MAVSPLYKNPYRDRDSHYKDKMVSPLYLKRCALYKNGPWRPWHPISDSVVWRGIGYSLTYPNPIPRVFVINPLSLWDVTII